MPPGRRIIITMGEVSGKMEKATAIGPWGFENTEKNPT